MGKLEALQELKKAWILRYGNTNQINRIITSEISELMATKTKLTPEVLNSIEEKLRAATRFKSPTGDKLATLYSNKSSSASAPNIKKILTLTETNNLKKNILEKNAYNSSTAEIRNPRTTNILTIPKNITKSSSDYLHVKYPKPAQVKATKNSGPKMSSASISPMKPMVKSRDVHEYPRSVQATSRLNSSSLENLSEKYDWGKVARREYEIYEEQMYAQRRRSTEEKQKYQDYLKKQMTELQNKQSVLKYEDQKEKLKLDTQLKQIKLEEKLQKQEEKKQRKFVKDIMDQNIHNLEKTRQRMENMKSEDKDYINTKAQEDELMQNAEVQKRRNMKKILASEFNQMIDEKYMRKVSEKEKERQEEKTKKKELQVIMEKQERNARDEKDKLFSMQVKVDTLTKLVNASLGRSKEVY